MNVPAPPTRAARLLAEFDTLFRGADLAPTYARALSGKLKLSCARSLCWRLFLGALPEDRAGWRAAVAESRTEFDRLVEQHEVDPHADEGEGEVDLAVNNPLSQAEDSKWGAFFERSELEKVIQQDIGRTYPEMEYFRSDDVQDKMRRVLYIWSCENSDVSYRQGMHELLAPLLYVLDREYLDLSAVGDAAGEDVAGAASAPEGADGGADAAKAGDNGDDGEGATPAPAAVSASDAAAASASDAASRSVFPAAAVLDAFDRRFLVHDLYTIFERVMRQMKPFFAPGNPGTGGAGASGEVGGIVRKCHKLHHVVLRKYDPELYNYLERHEIEPQLYSLRWVRLLLSREFHLEDVLVLWDAVFAESSDFGLVDYIIVAMLVYIREDVLGRDYSSCLRRLFKYPPVDNVAIFVAEALQMRNPDTKAGNVSFSTQGGVNWPPANAKDSKATRKQQRQLAEQFELPSVRAVRQFFDKKTHTMDAPSSRFLNEALTHLEDDVHRMRATQWVLGQRMESIVETLSAELMQGGAEINHNSVLMALAELKQVRDILTDQLPLDDLPARIK